MKFLVTTMFAFFGTTAAVQACPTFSMTGVEQYNATGQQLYSPQRYSVVAGGDNYIFNCSQVRPLTDTGPGYFASQPDFSFFLSGMGPYSLHITVTGLCDSAVLINTGAANWYYDDDDYNDGSGGAQITLNNPSNGRIDIWAGTYEPGYCDAVLTLETF
ncbi:putative Y2126 family protein [Octadecabacter antarcticus 307]|uniref:Putative Y2126 family protein n=1 Tax=Octadecabacter antarcticus 307 TaxID=391626 RepID=M9R6W3_9RHOB|nr:hypothetical protein [Octadecabacter antarcticus]AGI68399.1 putative Y2126 family protein [Octadecabacter antarcticus 307]